MDRFMREKQAFMLRRREPNPYLSSIQSLKWNSEEKTLRSTKKGYGLKNCC
jgi:hypothetical protein